MTHLDGGVKTGQGDHDHETSCEGGTGPEDQKMTHPKGDKETSQRTERYLELPGSQKKIGYKGTTTRLCLLPNANKAGELQNRLARSSTPMAQETFGERYSLLFIPK